MSPQLHDMAIIRDMQQALRMLDRLDCATHRATVYVIAGIEDVDILRFDAEALRTERLRRSIYGEHTWKASQLALA